MTTFERKSKIKIKTSIYLDIVAGGPIKQFTTHICSLGRTTGGRKVHMDDHHAIRTRSRISQIARTINSHGSKVENLNKLHIYNL